MQLTQHTDFGLRLLIVLTRMEGGPISLPSFAAEQRLSYNHVSKVAQALVRTRFIRSLRGKLEPDPARPRYILTETGIGYRLQTD